MKYKTQIPEKCNFREQDKEWGKIAVTLQVSTPSESFAKWETHLARAFGSIVKRYVKIF